MEQNHSVVSNVQPTHCTASLLHRHYGLLLYIYVSAVINSTSNPDLSSLPSSSVYVLGCSSAGLAVTQSLVSWGADWLAVVDRAGRPAAAKLLLQTQK